MYIDATDIDIFAKNVQNLLVNWNCNMEGGVSKFYAFFFRCNGIF